MKKVEKGNKGPKKPVGKVVQFVDYPVETKIAPNYSYFKLATLCLNTPKQDGLGTEEVRERLSISGKLTPKPVNEKGEAVLFAKNNEGLNYIELSPKELNTLLEAFAIMKWNVVESFIVDFEDYIKELKETL